MAPPSRLVSGRYPPPGVSPIADAIRERRGERGLIPLDAVLLHVPAVADGWNTLLGAVRSRGALPGDIRELMILRTAALNHAAYEWVQHEPVGRAHGLTSAQLYIIRDTSTPLPPAEGILSPFQLAALRFADANTRHVQVSTQIRSELMLHLKTHVKASSNESREEEAEDLFVEAAAVVATYNMVSRFLVSTDVSGLSDNDVPWPIELVEHFIPIPSETDPTTHTHKIHAVTLTTSPSAPWVVLANSLLTDLNMWGCVVPYLLQSFNILLHSQRGHGQSTLPPASPSSGQRQTTIPSLAYDIAHIIHILQVPTPIHAIIGVSQGGAAALAFSSLTAFFPSATSLPSPLPTAKCIVACDTSARTAAGNKSAWEERASVVFGTDISFDSDNYEKTLDNEYAAKLGMPRLADAFVARWFPPGSPLSSPSTASGQEDRSAWIRSFIKHTPPRGFLAGAQALADFDLVSQPNSESGVLGPSFNASSALKVLLLAGALDGGGKVGQGLKALAERWAKVREGITYVEIPEAGHLPMVDQPERWWKVVNEFLQSVS